MSSQIYRSLLSAVRYLSCVKRFIYTNRILYGTHYDTLKLPRNCSAKDVREAFIKLSKQCHPDINQNNPNTHAQFVKLNEAYSILIRPEKRRKYDLSLKPEVRQNRQNPEPQVPRDVYTTAYRQRVVWREGAFWEYQDKSKYEGDPDSYYGIKGIRKVTNGYIAFLCFMVATVGLVIQIILIRESTAFSRKRLDEQSQEAGRVLAEVQQQALLHGNKKQLEKLKERIEEQSNPSNDKSQSANTSFKSTNKKDRPEQKSPQETCNISNITSIPNKVSHPCNMSGPNVIILPDVETNNPSEESLWIRPTLGLIETPHTLANENGHMYDVVINDVLEKESTESFSDIVKIDLRNPITVQNSSHTETPESIETVVPNQIHTALMEDVNAGVLPINHILPLQRLDLNKFELLLGSGHDVQLTIHQNCSACDLQEVTEQVSISDYGKTFCEFGNDQVLDDIFNCLGKTASTVDIEKAPKSSL